MLKALGRRFLKMGGGDLISVVMESERKSFFKTGMVVGISGYH